jgi:bifunctional N-acetylglucosamine-1-phosphate-uridyltransferase/glucosamine-1-phosphate-acetyltransferase GlmU-like protein
MGEVGGDTVLVVPGDTPLLRPETLRALVAALPGAPAALLTAVMPDPTGYGRVVREGVKVVGIVEHRDATPEQRLISEVAVSTYAFAGGALAGALAGLSRGNDQGEYYLTDAVAALAAGGEVRAVPVADPAEVQGVNSHGQLASVAAVAAETGAHSQCAVEESMACGIGVCMTCVLPVRGSDGVTRMVRSCTDGPVFRGSDVRWSDVGTVPADTLGAPVAGGH